MKLLLLHGLDMKMKRLMEVKRQISDSRLDWGRVVGDFFTQINMSKQRKLKYLIIDS